MADADDLGDLGDLGDTTETLARIGRNSLVLLLAQAATWLLSAVAVFIIPRYFGPAAISWYAVAASLWVTAGTLIGVGTSLHLTRQFALRRDEAGRLVGPVLRIRLLASGVAFVGVIGFTLVTHRRREVVAMAVIIGVATIVGSLADVAGSALAGLERFGDVSRANVTAKLAATIAALGTLWLTHDIYLVAASGVVLGVVLVGMQFRALRRQATFPLRSNWVDVRSIVRTSSPFLVAGLALVVYQQIDVVVMSFLVDDRQLGWYGAADGVFSTLLFAPTLLMSSLMPALTREHATDAVAARRLVGQAFDGLVLFSFPLGAAMIVCARSGVRLLYGPKFAGAAPVLAVYGVVLLFMTFAILFGGYATAIGRQRFWNVVMVVAIGATIPLDLVLVPWTAHRFHNGAIAGALSYVVTESMMIVAGLAVLARHLLTVRHLRRVVGCLVAAAAQVAVAWPLRNAVVVVPAAVGAATYGVLVVALRVPTAGERALAGRALRRLTRQAAVSRPVG